MWSLISPRAKDISGSKNFRSPPQKDFCNSSFFPIAVFRMNFQKFANPLVIGIAAIIHLHPVASILSNSHFGEETCSPDVAPGLVDIDDVMKP